MKSGAYMKAISIGDPEVSKPSCKSSRPTMALRAFAKSMISAGDLIAYAAHG